MNRPGEALTAAEVVAYNTGIPAALLTGDTVEACQAQAAALLEWRASFDKYPEANDGGEIVIPDGGGHPWGWIAENL